MKQNANKRKPDDGEKQMERVRRICLSLPETWEKISHGEPIFFVHKKVFAMCSNNHHNDGHIAVTIPAAIGIQAMLIKRAPEKFYRPPYVGVSGWVGIELDRVGDEELTLHIHEAWRLIAPEKLQAVTHVPRDKEVPEKRAARRRAPRPSAGKRKI
ncbi:hypothetical protein BH18ACI4_BH18ACI4_20610 [soil metagenome]